MTPFHRALPLALLLGTAMGAAGEDLLGRVIDLQRNPLPGVKVVLQPQGIVTVTQADGSFRLPEAGLPASLARQARPSDPGAPAASGLGLDFRPLPGIAAVDLRGRRSPGGGPWMFLAFLSRPGAASPQASLPLAKAAGIPSLTAEKPGFQTASIPLMAGAVLRDIVLAPAIDLSGPLPITGGNGYTVPPLPRTIGFSGSTSTELPNLHDPTDSSGGRVDSVKFVLHWELSTESGAPLFVRPQAYFPRFPERLDAIAPETISNEDGQASLDLLETAPNRDGQVVPPENLSVAVNLLLWSRGSGSAYGTLRCLQFPGPIKAGWKSFEDLNGRIPISVRTHLAGSVPALDLAGKVAGKIAWKGPGPMPELWIGMVGTDLFAPIAPDGGFLSTDLPPGRPPVVLVRVDRSDDGAAIPRAFQGLEGLEVVSGQTSVLESILLEGD